MLENMIFEFMSHKTSSLILPDLTLKTGSFMTIFTLQILYQ